ncbi:MAG: TIGR03960 family B12-binding radical SAM protein [Nitrospirae bacterium]|nr:MAG: TIGR03960 family B12-binding radical SAM protein [Nitrospirota bacterium]
MNYLKFQRPSRYIDSEVNSIKKEAGLRFALAFPDTYEVGMSHLGMKILYHIINSTDFAVAERVFAPWTDLLQYMEQQALPLGSLESGRPLRDFHVVGFSLQYELSYPTVLRMLRLGFIPLRREERTSNDPIVIAGGPCTVNPAPLSDFIDAFFIGDAEDVLPGLLQTLKELIDGQSRRDEILKALAAMEGFYVPGFTENFPVKRVFVRELNQTPFPTSPVVPYTQIVHDRVNIEISRGCTRGCRFCQAGMIYRPLRERSPRRILSLVEESLKNTGYDEVSFTSLSAGDYSGLLSLLRAFNQRFSEKRVSLSLPSLRVGALTREVLQEIKSVKKSGFTIAPEAATDRLRAVINKDFSMEDYERAVNLLFSEGWLNLKLYFMAGLPTETEEDIEEIIKMAKLTKKIARKYTKRHVNITVSLSPFVPKPHTPFQWAGQMQGERLRERIEFLRKNMPGGVAFKNHNIQMSMLEAALSRADASVGRVLEEVALNGAYLDGWSEQFDYQRWIEAMDKTGIDLERIAVKTYEMDETLPWDIIDVGVKRDFLKKEYRRAVSSEWTADCSVKGCAGCGLGCKSGEFLAREDVGRLEIYGAKQKKRFSPVMVRVCFEKGRKLRYLSHLELVQAMLRGLRRAGVDLVYSQGYHPSPKVSFGPPLNVGVSGLNEYFDMHVYPPFNIKESVDRINNSLPEGLRIKSLRKKKKKLPSLSSFISRYTYRIRFNSSTDIKLSLAGSEFSDFIEKFDIIGKKEILLTLKDLKDRKVKLSDIIRGLFNRAIEDVEIERTALYGFYRGWLDPMEAVDRFPDRFDGK